MMLEHYGVRSFANNIAKSKHAGLACLKFMYGGDKGDRTPDLLTASQALSRDG
ncbi:hypothetical protein J31TS6_03690 [Brevibacillus reuszeri]|uniref:hypothetical protein n=1 Tax=Brevibacillus reuszeri TaxID=54915 RepID=UPI001B2673AB|nr:hypothetical protein [Brevibacillus reuszeri]GIO04341.1 hypothetical protein J31TS6_03690 [Brevibacillus reuszeri]